MAGPIIRKATLKDTQKILAIYAHYVENTAITFEYIVPSIDEFRERIRKTLLKYPYLVLESGEEILGYAYAGAFVGRAAYDWSAEVTKMHTRNSLTKALQEMGILNLYACIGYPNEEDEYLTRNSAQFHKHLGYRQVGIFSNCGFKFGRWYSMIWMEKMIGEHTENPKAR